VSSTLAPELDAAAPRLGFDEFLRVFDFRQGEHVTLIGHTGSGKTTLSRFIMAKRRWVVFCATKPADSTASDLVKHEGYTKRERWPPSPLDERVVLWPKITSMDHAIGQRAEFGSMLRDIYGRGSWCVNLDEIEYLTDFPLHLEPEIKLLLRQGRALKVSIIGGTQRPRHIPLVFYDQATHVFIWHDNDQDNLRRLRELGGRVDRRILEAIVRNLRHHEFVYVHTRSGLMLRSSVGRG
jgi:hypothetical protein